MQMDALLIEIEQQVALILANEDGGDAALLFYGQPCQLCATFQVVYPHLNKYQHGEVGGLGSHDWRMDTAWRVHVYEGLTIRVLQCQWTGVVIVAFSLCGC